MLTHIKHLLKKLKNRFYMARPRSFQIICKETLNMKDKPTKKRKKITIVIAIIIFPFVLIYTLIKKLIKAIASAIS